MIKKIIKTLLVIASVLAIVGCMSAPKNFHSLYYFDSIQIYNSDKALVFVKKNWWDCTEYAYYGYNQLSKDYKSEIVLGTVFLQKNKNSLPSPPLKHAWVEYIKDGEIKIFDFLQSEFVYIKHIPQEKGRMTYNYIRTEQFLRFLGYDSAIINYYFIELDMNKPVILYKKLNDPEWKVYIGEFDDLRPEEYKWVD